MLAVQLLCKLQANPSFVQDADDLCFGESFSHCCSSLERSLHRNRTKRGEQVNGTSGGKWRYSAVFIAFIKYLAVQKLFSAHVTQVPRDDAREPRAGEIDFDDLAPAGREREPVALLP